MQNSIRRLRHLAFIRQAGLCCYCHFPMWLAGHVQYARSLRISVRAARRFQCTAEHLLPLSQGGRNEANNVAAACLFCNRTRHRAKSVLASHAYQLRVQKRLAARRWHPLSIAQAQQALAADARKPSRG
jgi:hypothetical protein